MRPLPVESVPAAPAFVSGVALIRGVPTPVVDAGALIGSEEPPAFTRFVTLRSGEAGVALAVEEVLGVRDVPPASLKRLPPLLRDASTEILSALGALDAELLTMLKLARTLTDRIVKGLETGMSAVLDIGEVDRFRLAILRWLGLDFDDSKRGFLLEVLRRRVHGRSADAYLDALEGVEKPQEELRALAQELTVTETSFFRNADQIRALNEVAIPDRMEARADTRRLSILSAGCASGEEAYTLAACIRDTPGSRDWDVAIRAIDINTAMLGKAAAARYSPWSLRSTPPALKRRLFRPDGRDFVLDESIRKMVRFEERNLTVEDEGFWVPGRFDIVFCRNVIMYFTPEIARAVLTRIARSLAPGGYLFLGHAESLRGMSTGFHLRHTHETFYYQRKDGEDVESVLWPPRPAPGAAIETPIDPDDSWIDTIRNASQRIRAITETPKAPRAKPAARRAAAPATPAKPVADVRAALDLLGREQYAEAQQILEALPPDRARDPEVLLLSAVLQTHGGNLVAAEAVCEELLRLDEMNAGAHYLMALCRESAGDFARAADHDQIAAYLDATFAMPRLHLGLLARRAGDREGAARELRQALLLLQREDSARLLVFGGGFARSQLITLARAELALCGEAA